MKTQHAPGQWLVGRLASPDYAPQYGIYSESDTNDFAIIKGDNAEANAKLIASAPDMLSVLQALNSWLIAPDVKPESLEWAAHVTSNAIKRATT